jgi:phosphoglycerol transferase MdoB-like AlkP superfamily enzyme
MPENPRPLVLLLKRLGALLALYTICRLLFFLFHLDQFGMLPASELALIFAGGIRFDISVIFMMNFLFIALSLMPFPLRDRAGFKTFLKYLFLVPNILAMLVNCIDMAYYSFTLKRSTADIFNFFTGSIGNDAARLIPVFLLNYWYIVLIFIGLSWVLILIYRRTEPKKATIWTPRFYLRQTIVFLAAAVVMVIGYRGGFQLKPISNVDAASYSSGSSVALVLNSPFSILKTVDQDAIEPSIFFPDEKQLRKLYDPHHRPLPGQMKKLNVVLIALESFSKEYVGALNQRPDGGYTPFLDSLIREGLVLSNAYSNGKKSIEGIPAITASLPSWMNEAFITSPYGSNQISSLAAALEAAGYSTAFFHGGTNGTMGFDAFASLAGYDKYYGRKEYNNEKDYDGNWGIWDEEFLQYSVKKMNGMKSPFFTTIFTLTSHHPYPVPEKYKGWFREGPLPIHHSVGYTDYALKKFFESAAETDWYRNTLFVLCADHTGISADPFYINKVGNNAIPILFYMRSDPSLRGENKHVSQQIDIMPSVLDLLDYDKPFFSFGTSVFDSAAAHFALSINGSQYDLIEGDHVLSFDGQKATSLFYIPKDSLLSTNILLVDTIKRNQMEQRVKAVLQTYQQSLINNKMR